MDDVLAEEDPGLGGQAQRRFAIEGQAVVGRKVGRPLEVAIGFLDQEVGKLGQVLAADLPDALQVARAQVDCGFRGRLPGGVAHVVDRGRHHVGGGLVDRPVQAGNGCLGVWQ